MNKPEEVYTIAAGEYCIKYDISEGSIISNLPNESKYIIDSDFQTYNGWDYSGDKSTRSKIKIAIQSDGTKELQFGYTSNPSYRDTVMKFDTTNNVTYIWDYRSSVIFANDIEVDKDTYDLFYAIYETIKVITPGTYKWVQNVELNFMNQMSLNFKSNNTTYSLFGVDSDPYRLFYSTSSWGTPTVYDSSGWVSEAYKTFEVLEARNVGRSIIYYQFTNGKIVKQTGYTVTLHLAGDSSYFPSSVSVYQCDVINDANQELLATFTSPSDADKVVTVTKPYIVISPTAQYISVTGDTTINIIWETCLTGDTLITLADRTTKRIDELDITDKVLSYNSNGELVADKILYTDSNENKTYDEFDIWTFNNGIVIKTVHRHRFYNVERKAMVYMDEWEIGEHTLGLDGKLTSLIKHETIKETVKHYTLFTEHQNYFANGLLSGNRWTKDLNLEP